MYTGAMTLALLYCRADADESEAPRKLKKQELTLVKEAQRRGFDYKVILEEDRAEVEGSRDRLAEALDLLDEHRADVLMAVRLDRFDTDREDASSVFRRSAARGWGLIIAGDPLGAEAASQRFQEHLDELVASKKRSQLTREGIERRKLEGAVFGRVVEQTFLPTYRKVLSMTEDGLSMNEIARRLNEQGVMTARGGRWHASTVRAILSSDTAKRLA